MIKRILPLAILCCSLCIGQGKAAVCFRGHFYYVPNGLETVTGTIQAMGRNDIIIFDELQKRLIRFVDLDQGRGVHLGDYVRIYFHPQSSIAVKIKKMTVLPYKANGQNLGNIFHQ